MANKERGESSLTVRGKSYTIRPSLNAACALEEVTGKDFTEIAKAAERGQLSAIRSIVWAYLQPCHSDEIKSFEDAGQWTEDAGGWQVVAEALQKVNGLNATTGQRRGPRKAQPTPGEPSTLRAVGQG